MGPTESPRSHTHGWVTRAFTAVEDIVYVGLGLLLTGIALVLLVKGFIRFGQIALFGRSTLGVVELLDQILLILLIVELLYTVQVSFRDRALIPEPFLLVGLISAIRRVLILTAEFGNRHENAASDSRHFVIELAVHTLLILILAVSLMVLRKAGAPAVAKHD